MDIIKKYRLMVLGAFIAVFYIAQWLMDLLSPTLTSTLGAGTVLLAIVMFLGTPTLMFYTFQYLQRKTKAI